MMDECCQNLATQLERANADLQFVAHKLEAEFNTKYLNYPEAHNPLGLLQRIDNLRSQLPALQQDCESIQAKKHELATCTQQKMLENREMIRRLQAAAGLPVSPATATAVALAPIANSGRH